MVERERTMELQPRGGSGNRIDCQNRASSLLVTNTGEQCDILTLAVGAWCGPPRADVDHLVGTAEVRTLIYINSGAEQRHFELSELSGRAPSSIQTTLDHSVD